MPVVFHEWVIRARCGACGDYLWTTPGSPNVVCKCGQASLVNDALAGTAQGVFDEAAFKIAVSQSISTPVDDISLVGP